MGSFNSVFIETEAAGKKLIVTPYLRSNKDKENRLIQEDIRLMIEARCKPADFLGVKVQVAINKGSNGTIPYMYTVFMCKGQGPTYSRLSRVDYAGYIQ